MQHDVGIVEYLESWRDETTLESREFISDRL